MNFIACFSKIKNKNIFNNSMIDILFHLLWSSKSSTRPDSKLKGKIHGRRRPTKSPRVLTHLPPTRKSLYSNVMIQPMKFYIWNLTNKTIDQNFGLLPLPRRVSPSSLKSLPLALFLCSLVSINHSIKHSNIRPEFQAMHALN